MFRTSIHSERFGSKSRRVRKGSARIGRRTANRFAYVFGPILIFVAFLTVWYVASPSSFNTMTEAVSKFIKAWRG